ncbi:MAG TPA: FHA domain-containing protein [Vicinamibacterales bacterium]|jgi:hypothetical protein
MDILGKARKLESRIARTIDDAAERLVRSGPRDPLETVHAIVDAVETEIQPAGRGKWLFPFNRIKATVVAATRDERARLEAILDGQPNLQERLQARLRASGCQGPDIEVRTVYVGKAQPAWVSRDFHLEFTRVLPRTDVDESSGGAHRIEFAVVHGTAQRRTYSFGATCIDFGRGVEVRDSRGRLIRTNQVAFTESGGAPNQSVSRRHAHVAYNATGDDYRIVDDGSAQGTTVVREGRSVTVPRGTRGIRLQSGDEIVLGEARVRVKIDRAPGSVRTARVAT